MKTPQEIQVWHILPALRKQLALGLKMEGLKQKEIASLLELTESAISQYLKKKRGNEINFPKKIREDIGLSAKRISEDKATVHKEIQRLLKKIEESGFLCDVCHNYLGTNSSCNVCH